MSYFNIAIIFMFLFPISLWAQEDINSSSWKLKDSLMETNQQTEKVDSPHQIKLGYNKKNITQLNLSNSSSDFIYDTQEIPGVMAQYDYNFNVSILKSSFYSSLGYYTKYNDLGSQGYADLSIFDLYAGFSLGYTFFEEISLTPKIFGGVGHAYYFQRGDISEANADKNYLENEYGVAMDMALKSSDAFPDSWSSRYVLSLRYSEFESFNSVEKLKGNKISALVGVQI